MLSCAIYAKYATNACTRTYLHTRACTRTPSHMHVCACAQASMHACTHARTHARQPGGTEELEWVSQATAIVCTYLCVNVRDGKMRLCAHAGSRTCVHACVRSFVRSCGCAGVHVCTRACVRDHMCACAHDRLKVLGACAADPRRLGAPQCCCTADYVHESMLSTQL